MDKRILLLRISYWTGAVLDGLWIIPMLFPGLGGMIFGIDNFNPGGEYRYAMGVGASLMLGWTLLLVWADRKPVERRGVLLLTVFPVILCLNLATIFLLVYEIIPAVRVIAAWGPSLGVAVLFLYSYFHSGSLIQEGQ
jgi:hypothetical protein